jgi:hypothetical protein
MAQETSITWEEFEKHMLRYGGGKTPTQLSIYFECHSMRTDKREVVSTPTTLNSMEALFQKLRQQPTDDGKIAMVCRAIHPQLRSQVAYQASGQEWSTYLDFRGNLLSRAVHFDKETNVLLKSSKKQQQQQERKGQASKRAAGSGLGPRKHATKNANPKGDGCYKCGQPGHKKWARTPTATLSARKCARRWVSMHSCTTALLCSQMQWQMRAAQRTLPCPCVGRRSRAPCQLM